MRELVYYVAVSIDGFIADPSGGYGEFSVEGDHMAAILGEYSDALPAHIRSAVGLQSDPTLFDTVIMGWNTLVPALEAGIESPYPHLRQFVASRQARSTAPDITLTNDPLSTVTSLKQEDGLGIWLCGGGELAGQLLPAIDRLILKRNPTVFGAGIPLFAHANYSPKQFTLASTRAFSSGVTIEEYVAESAR